MTDQEIEQNVDAYKAWLKGEPVEVFQFEDVWRTLGAHAMIDRTVRLRRKPAPKLRAWKPEEVPMGAILRNKKDPRQWGMITCCIDGEPKFGIINQNCSYFEKCWETCEHSTDGGKTWKPCGVEE